MGPQRMYGLTLWVRRLLVANLLVFLVQSTLLTSPSFRVALGFNPMRAWEQPWSFLTYMFLHENVLHLAFNMLMRSEEHTSELQSLRHLVCRLLLEKKNKHNEHAGIYQACGELMITWS